ncbi:hypothetical protein BG015_010399 [Linnemannia schmuckeri]|uniref:Uncharacterized protein n=1 Tax=Linnemannia schmuckeri TaxID=64567 RepID=A0A9P5S591_9FUNG|nr:hypothetical protein BG015_010399 [Linnemannia schmuckeri]
MTATSSRPLRWLTLGSLALMALSGGACAGECPAAVTVTKTETLTVWADGSWPTKTVTQLVVPDNCPPEPRYSCYVVQTTTLSAQVPQATIQMVLPQQQEESNKQEWNSQSEDDGEEEEQANDNSKGDAPELVSDPSIISFPSSPTPATATGPACVNYVTALSMGPCPTFITLPTNSEGCAIITSTTLAMATVTAAPGVDVIYTQSYPTGHSRGHHGRNKHKKHPHKPVPAATAAATPLPTPPPAVALFPPGEQKQLDASPTKTEFTTSFSTHYSYTLSFNFAYATLKPSPIPGTFLPELPAPTPMFTPTTPTTTIAPTEVPLTPADPAILSPTDPADPPASFDPMDPAANKVSRLDDPSTADSFVPATLDETGQTVTAEQPEPELITKEATPELPDETGQIVTIDQPELEPITKEVVFNSTGLKKACQECAEPCFVELNVAAKAEVSLLDKMFEDKIKKALDSLKLTLKNESGSTSVQDQDNSNSINGSGVPTGLFAGLNIDENTAGLFRKTCEDKVDAIEKKHIEALNKKCEQVIRTGCETGACLQSEIDKAVKLLDVMISTELARDCSQLRSEIVREFKSRCDQDRKAKDKNNVEKRGLLSGLLGDDNMVDKVVNGLGETVNKVVAETVTPLTGSDLIERLVGQLTRTVKSVVDSFVGNCNRKGLLDFDTEEGVGALAAIRDVSLSLSNIVCVHVQADAKVDISAQ